MTNKIQNAIIIGAVFITALGSNFGLFAAMGVLR
jgi:hypothetical protein